MCVVAVVFVRVRACMLACVCACVRACDFEPLWRLIITFVLRCLDPHAWCTWKMIGEYMVDHVAKYRVQNNS